MVLSPSLKQNIIRDIDPNVLQGRASNPLDSVWVGASAGSGKTKVLTDRILRLLLPLKTGQSGSAPHKILALTFTKAAASEMALRISKNLSDWAVIPLDGEDGLKEKLKKLLGEAPTQEQISVSRQLFASVVDVPGGLKIMTIHSFCQSILSHFPLEADLPPSFNALEESDAKILLKKAIEATLEKAEEDKGSPLSEALYNISQSQNEDQLTNILKNIVSEQRQFQKILKKNFDIDGFYTNLCQHFGLTPGQSIDDILSSYFKNLNQKDLWHASKVLQQEGKKKDKTLGLNLQIWLENNSQFLNYDWENYKLLFLTQKNEIRKNLVTKDISNNNPDITDILSHETQNIVTLHENMNAIKITEQTRDIFILGKEVLEKYENIKKINHSLDFDDLVLKTLQLLKGETKTLNGLDPAPWVRYKMDQGIDHILVDESQDTNPEQWEIIQSLCDDFYEDIENNDTKRTVFIVGDEKQSIFSFQRASPEKFHDMRHWFDKKIQNTGQSLNKIQFNISFRSVPAVLNLVDSIFSSDIIRSGLGDNILQHQSYRQSQAGLVELWPLFESPEKQNNDPWALPIETRNSTSGAAMMADHIGKTIQQWLDDKKQLESYNRPIQAGDIMILVRSRTAFIDQLVRALKIRDIPVSGVDRMILSTQLVVQDLCALANFALLPENDLNLATILKSPLIGFNEEELFNISYKRQSSLWNNLKASGIHEKTKNWLQNLIQMAGKSTPYEFFMEILQNPCPAHPLSGLQAIKSRLGEECFDPLNEFLNSALEYEDTPIASLQNFVQSQLYDDTQIKRQMDDNKNAVRIMTVHGAKGLQAPIVILPDTTRTANSYKHERLLWPDKTKQPFPYFCPTSDNLPEPCVQAKNHLKDLDTQEYRRLLYVALTRAESHLYIGGYKGSKAVIEDSWYNDITQGFELLDNVEKIELNNNQFVLRYTNAATDKPDREEQVLVNQNTKAAVPYWLFQAMPEEPFPPRPLMPSRPSESEAPALSPLKALDNSRFKRGNITHKLLQILPDLAPDNREAAAHRYVRQPAHNLSPSLQQNIVTEVMNILNHPDFAPIFGAGSVAEAPVTGLINGNRLVSGQIDRLLVTENQILIIDYKSNRPPPENVNDVPAIYINQMRTYADLMRAIYPDHKIKAALLWTDGCRLMPLDNI